MEPSVLIVENDDAIQMLLQTLLTHVGFPVSRAQSPSEALERIATEAPSAIVLDLNFPYSPGWEAYQAIKANSDVPVLVLTGHPLQAEDVLHFLRPNDDCVLKPFDILELAERLRTVAGREQVRYAG